MISAYIAICYVISLRGNGCVLLDLRGLNRHWKFKTDEYFFIALQGKIKGEKHDLAHIIPCSNITSTGIPVRSIVARLLKHKSRLNQIVGPAISDYTGKRISPSKFDESLVQCLEEIYAYDKSLFPVDIQRKINDKINECDSVLKLHYSRFRSFRRTSNTRAMEIGNKLQEDDINIVNRWRKKEGAKGKRNKMRQHYAEVELLLRPFLRYTKAM